MKLSHDDVVAFAQTFGLIDLMVIFVSAAIYAYWPSLGPRFDRAAKSVLDDGGPRPACGREHGGKGARPPHAARDHRPREWAGITELNARVSWLVWFFIAVSHIWALVHWVLMPAIPLVTTCTRGLLGYDPRGRAEADVVEAEAEAARAPWTDRVEALTVADLRADPNLMPTVNQVAPALFGDNCAACHGEEATGNQELGAPNLSDEVWLWGESFEDVHDTVWNGR